VELGMEVLARERRARDLDTDDDPDQAEPAAVAPA
jgi:hypothetical protein